MRGQKTLVKAPRPGKRYRMEDCQRTSACIPGWRQAALPGSFCQAGWEVLTQTTKPQPAAAAVLPSSLILQLPCKSRNATQATESLSGTDCEPAQHWRRTCCPTTPFFPICSRNKIQTVAVTTASALAQQTPLCKTIRTERTGKTTVQKMSEGCVSPASLAHSPRREKSRFSVVVNQAVDTKYVFQSHHDIPLLKSGY